MTATGDQPAPAPEPAPDALHARVAQSVQARGFFPAWREHFADIAHRHGSGEGAIARGSLWHWLSNDPAVREADGRPMHCLRSSQ